MTPAQESKTKGVGISPTQEEVEAAEIVSLVIFRLGTQWLALSTQVVREVMEMRTIRSIPQRTTEVLLGLVNLRGELQLCVSLKGVLSLEGEAVRAQAEDRQGTRRLVVLEKEEVCWAFPADEVFGVFHFSPGEMQELPTTPSEGTPVVHKGIVYWQDKQVSYVDETVLFDTLKRRI